MTNSEYIKILSRRLGYAESEASALVSTLTGIITRHLQARSSVSVAGFGTFTVKKMLERISTNAMTGEKTLVPPSLEVRFITSDEDLPNPGETVSARDISLSFARTLHIDTTDAEAFVREFFSLAHRGIETDNYVNIKVFGTFKKIEGKVSFTPEKSVSQAVNKPFSQFEAVAVSDDADIEALERKEEEPEPARVEPEEEHKEEAAVEESAPEAEPAVVEPKPEPAVAAVREPSSLPWTLILTIFLSGMVIGGFITGGIMSCSHERSDAESAQASVSSPAKQEPKSAAQAEESQPAVSVKPLSDKVSYEITGTLATHTIRKGESLATIARKYYGNSRLWNYIARHNRKTLKDPDNLPVGLSIEIPELREK